jgi:hypothetical protein
VYGALTTLVLRIDGFVTRTRYANADTSAAKALFASHLAEYCALVRPEDRDIDRILRFAIAIQNLSVVRQLINEHGANVLQKDSLHRTAIFYLAVGDESELSSDFDVAKLVVDCTCGKAGVDALKELNEKDSESKTALWYAVWWAAEEVVTVLLSRGADPHTCNNVPDSSKDRRGVLHMLRVSRLVQLRPNTLLRVERRIGKAGMMHRSYYDVRTLQRNPEYWSGTIRQSIERKNWDRRVTWIESPSTNVSLYTEKP